MAPASRLRWSTYAAPSRFYALVERLDPWLWALAALLSIAGLYVGFFVAPTDATQSEAYRIIFIHVPAAWMSMVLYLAMADTPCPTALHCNRSWASAGRAM